MYQPFVHSPSQSNILISDKGEVCIADFGLSRELEVSGFKTEFVRGTTRWMAHELLSYEYHGGNVPPVPVTTAASDTWAFGMTVLEVRSLLPHVADRSNDFGPDTHGGNAILLVV